MDKFDQEFERFSTIVQTQCEKIYEGEVITSDKDGPLLQIENVEDGRINIAISQDFLSFCARPKKSAYFSANLRIYIMYMISYPADLITYKNGKVRRTTHTNSSTQCNTIEELIDELEYNRFLLELFPKASNFWNFRKHILRALFKDADSQFFHTLIIKERNLFKRHLFCKHPFNYSAGLYWRWFVKEFGSNRKLEEAKFLLELMGQSPLSFDLGDHLLHILQQLYTETHDCSVFCTGEWDTALKLHSFFGEFEISYVFGTTLLDLLWKRFIDLHYNQSGQLRTVCKNSHQNCFQFLLNLTRNYLSQQLYDIPTEYSSTRSRLCRIYILTMIDNLTSLFAEKTSSINNLTFKKDFLSFVTGDLKMDETWSDFLANGQNICLVSENLFTRIKCNLQ